MRTPQIAGGAIERRETRGNLPRKPKGLPQTITRTGHHKDTQNRIQLFVPILRSLLLFRGIITLSIINFVVFDKKSLSSFGFATSGDRLFLLSLK